jgi:hypothetical protein
MGRVAVIPVGSGIAIDIRQVVFSAAAIVLAGHIAVGVSGRVVRVVDASFHLRSNDRCPILSLIPELTLALYPRILSRNSLTLAFNFSPALGSRVAASNDEDHQPDNTGDHHFSKIQS